MSTTHGTDQTLEPEGHRRLLPVGVIVAGYLLLGMLWIFTSDPLGNSIAEFTSIPRWIVELGKGVLFVAITALVLSISMRGRANELGEAIARGHLRARRLTASEAHNRLQAAALSATANAVVITGRDGLIEWVNEAFEAMSGYSSLDAVGSTPRLLKSGQQDEAFYRDLWQTILTGQVWRGQVVNRRSDGELYTVSQTITPVVDDAGEVQHFVAIHEDVTERIRTLRALTVAEAQFRQLAENAADIVAKLRIDPDGRMQIDYVNPAATAILGYPRERFYNDREVLLQLFSQSNFDLEGALERLPTPDDPSSLATVQVQRADGRLVWLETHSTLSDPSTVPVTVQVVARDVTARSEMLQALEQALADQREAAEQLRRLNAMKDTFLQSISHELRTPLTSILGFAQLLVAPHGEPSPAETRDFHQRILLNARRLQRLMDDLFDIDRFTRGHLEPNRQPTDLTALIERMVHDLELGDREVELDLEPVTMDLDASWIERLMANLLRNIAQHTPPDARVWIWTRATADGVTLTVDDDGPGIPEADRLRLIEPFQQGSGAASSAQPGTGVGLSLVRTFAQLHGGDLTISDSLTGGARVTVTLAHPQSDDRHASTA